MPTSIDRVDDLDDLIARLHRREALSPAGLDDVLTRRLPEGLRLDYKSGKTMAARSPMKVAGCDTGAVV